MEKFKYITSFEILDYEAMLNNWFYVPEVDSFSFSFYSAGYETSLFYLNAAGFLAALLLLYSTNFIFFSIEVEQ